MKSTFSILTILFLSIHVFAQETFDGETKWGEPFGISKSDSGPYPVGILNDKFYSYKQNEDDVTLLLFDMNTLALEKEVPLEMKIGKKKFTRHSIFIFDGKLCMISYYVEKSAKKKMYVLHEFDANYSIENFHPIGETGWIPLGKKLTAMARERANNVGYFSFRYYISADRETMLTSFQNEDGGTDTRLFDKSLTLVAENSMDLPYEGFQTKASTLSNSGRFYLTGFDTEVVEGKGFKKDKVYANDFHILIFDAVDGEVTDLNIEINEKVSNCAIQILEDESFIAYGMYGSVNEEGYIDVNGTYIQKISKEGDIAFTSKNPIDGEMVQQPWSEDEETENTYRYKLHDLMIKDNGEYTVLVEQFYVIVERITTSGPNGSTTRTVYYYYYDDILAFNYSNEGSLIWQTRIEKRQYSYNDRAANLSFFPILVNDQIQLIYNVQESDINEDSAETISERRKQRKNTVALIVSVENNGEASRKILYNFEGDKSRTIVPNRCEEMEDGEIFIYTKGNRSEKILGWITL